MQRIALEKNSETMKTIPETPVFSVLARRKPPKGAVLDIPHTTHVCQNCFTDLCRKYPPEEQIQEVDEMTKAAQKKTNFKCYLCKCRIQTAPKVLYAKHVHKGEPFYPFLSSLSNFGKVRKLKVIINKLLDTKDIMKPSVYGYTYSCQHCHDELYKQWCVYEKERLPQSKRKYEKQIEALFESAEAEESDRPSMVVTNDCCAVKMETDKFVECYICARPLTDKFKVNTHPCKKKPSFLFNNHDVQCPTMRTNPSSRP